MSVDISFESMDDFSPAAVARKVGALNKLLQARTQLSNLVTYMDGKTGAEELIAKALNDPTLMKALAGVEQPTAGRILIDGEPIVLPSVTFNVAGRDNEILCGVYVADDRTAKRRVEYRGLGDDPSRGDDAVGPWFAQRFRHRISSSFELVEDFQLQVEHLLDCREGELLLFVDASFDAGPALRFAEVIPCSELGHTSHALTPAELLGQYPRLFASPPPPAFLLQIPGEQFELGQPMSPATRRRSEMAAQLVERLLLERGQDAWRALCTARCEPGHPELSPRSAAVQPSAAP